MSKPTPTADLERQIDGCPHCGQPPRIFFNDSGDYKSEHCWRIECLNEKCIPAPMMEHKDKQIAITAWNTRAFPALSPDNAGLREEVGRAIRDDDNDMPWGTLGDLIKSACGASFPVERQVTADHYCLRIAEIALAAVRKHVGGGQ